MGAQVETVPILHAVVSSDLYGIWVYRRDCGLAIKFKSVPGELVGVPFKYKNYYHIYVIYSQKQSDNYVTFRRAPVLSEDERHLHHLFQEFD